MRLLLLTRYRIAAGLADASPTLGTGDGGDDLGVTVGLAMLGRFRHAADRFADGIFGRSLALAGN